jgi:hypothetical protein
MAGRLSPGVLAMIQFPNALPLILALTSNPADLAQVSAFGIRAPQAGMTGRDRRQSFRALTRPPASIEERGAGAVHQRPAVRITGQNAPSDPKGGRNWQHISDDSTADELTLVICRQGGLCFQTPNF